jgi:ubiquinone/menaquinone biosynthesis C-methylase UbiE
MTKFELNRKTASFIDKYELFEDDEIQQIQLQHRLEIVDTFDIKEGMMVLEIGCGQGDTTVALADAVGKTGKVTGIDIASPDYGAPFTLGQATGRIKKSVLGERIDFHFETDLETFESKDLFDIAVLSHSSWYFKRPDDLYRYFKELRKMSKRVCLAEWDFDYAHKKQRSHFLAASILALHSTFVNNDGNIQNLFHRTQIQELLERADFQIIKVGMVDATYLQDGQWEKSYANSIRHEFANAPDMIQTLVASYYELMNATIDNEQSLNSFILCAE